MSSARRKKPSQKGTSLFTRKRAKSASKSKAGKTYRADEQKNRFVKPPHDPGPKIREDGMEVEEEYAVEEDGNIIPEALQSTGRGCCGSITGFFWLLGLGGIAVVIFLAVRCGGC